MIQSYNCQWFTKENNIFNSIFIYIKLILIFFIILSITFQSVIIASNNNRNSKDTDGDGFTDDVDPDDDNDGYNDILELDAGTDPLNASDYPRNLPVDSDGDTIPDLNDTDDDNDSLSDVEEGKIGTNPKLMDSDNDRLIDNKEINIGTNPLIKDTDSDTYWDNEEIYAGTDPLDPNSYPTTVIANAGPDQIIYPNEKFKLEGSFSIGNIERYSWDFNAADGIQIDSNGKKIEHIYTEEGIYTVTLRVTDGNTTDNDTCLIVVSNRLAVRLNIVKNRETSSIVYQKDIFLHFKKRDNNSITIEVSGELTTSALVIFTIDYYTMLVLVEDEVIVKFDDLIINNSNIIDMVTSKLELPLYNISIFNNSLRIIVYIPHFSTHTIQIEKVKGADIDERTQPVKPKKDVLIFWILIIIIILVISFVLTYSYKRIENMKFYSKLRIDDETVNIISHNNSKKKIKINWEDYDSEK